jgi:hypothetical protein
MYKKVPIALYILSISLVEVYRVGIEGQGRKPKQQIFCRRNSKAKFRVEGSLK